MLFCNVTDLLRELGHNMNSYRIKMTQENFKLKDYYTTSDLALATAVSFWYTLESVDKTNPQKVVFLFKRDEELDQLVESFWRGALKVDPQAYFNRLKVIKSRIYARE
jgi:hypothetical protein